jgi:hypothetical protein
MYQSIKTKAELKRLPIGTELVLVECLMGKCNDSRTIKQVRSNDIIMQLPDGRTSYCALNNKLESTEDGFLLRCEDGRVAVRYVVKQAN